MSINKLIYIECRWCPIVISFSQIKTSCNLKNKAKQANKTPQLLQQNNACAKINNSVLRGTITFYSNFR